MTDKQMQTDKEQIMIDGVDVNECFFYQSNFEEDYDVKIKHFCSNWHNSCESVNNSNCYFKQLARKTQECEELRVAYNKAQDILGRIDKANELKSLTIQKLAKQCEGLQEQLEFVRTHRTVIDAEKDRYRKALEEIEEYCNDYCMDDCIGDERLRTFDKCQQCISGDILDIINKTKE